MIRAMTDDERVVFCKLLDYHPTERFRGITRINGRYPSGMVGFDDFTASSCQIHVWLADAHAVSKDLICESFGYIFNQLNLMLVIGITPCNNAAALRLNERIGFKRTYTVKDGYAPGVDLAIQELRKEDCRWLRGRQI